MNELKPCPFCGKSVARVMSDAEMGGWECGQYVVICPLHEGGGYGCGSSGRWGDTIEEAVEYWNRRPEVVVPVKEIGKYIKSMFPDFPLPKEDEE